MLWTPRKGRTTVVTNTGIVGAARIGTQVPAHATTTLTQGAVTELISAANNTQDSWGVMVSIQAMWASATASESKMDILVGGATDDILLPSLICGYANDTNTSLGSGHTYFFPVHVPAGVRVAAALTSVRTNFNSRVAIWLYGGAEPPWRVGRKVTAYGTAINGARGVAVTPTASGGAASVTEITASTTEDHFAFLPGFQPATDASLGATGAWNIGIGVGSSTEDRIGTWHYSHTTAEDMTGPLPCFPSFHDVPSGSRLTLLASNNTTNDDAYDGHIYAVS